MSDRTTPYPDYDASHLEALRSLLSEATRLRAQLVDTTDAETDRWAARCTDSVIRPLRDALSRAGGSTLTELESRSHARGAHVGDGLAQLAVQATRLVRDATLASGVHEAAAALIDLAYSSTDEARAPLAAQIAELLVGLPASIRLASNGPYLVTNVPALTNWLGELLPARPLMALCRCGESGLKPLCDGTHARIGFTDTKDPQRVPDRRDTYPGLTPLTVLDNRGTCAHSGFCTDRLANAFRTGQEPFVAPTGARMDELIRAVRACPSGALSLAIDDQERRNLVDEPRPPSIEVSKDGPYRVTGAVQLIDERYRPPHRNVGASHEHYSLCRCGHSLNKPFCSGMHWYVSFADPVPAPDHEPTLFEWAGGLPALTRLTRRVYETHIPDDPLLAPRFASMAPDYPERVAAWLSEVFGGPQQDGGPDPAVFEPGRLDEVERAQFVDVFSRAADEVNLPSDPEFRAAFVSYLEWASRSARKDAPTGAGLLAGRPAAPWDWGTPGPPERVSGAPAVGSDAEAPAVSLPGPAEPVYYDAHIKTLFRASDRQAMSWAFDLWSYQEVAGNASAILERLRQGSMPCDGAWPPEQVGVFARWVDAGTPESAAGSAETPPVADGGSDDAQPIGGRLGNTIALRSTTPVEERPLVIEHREPLIYMLCSAAELEHALMCEYLFAAFTLKRSVDEGLSSEQLDAVERWRTAILYVAKQEMLHLAINSNLVTALGASPHLSRPNLPQPARHYPSGVRLTLLPFGEQALRHFLFLERPEGMDLDDAEGLTAVNAAVPVMSDEEIAPHLQEFATVGHLYRSIEAGFRHLADKWGDDKLFIGPAEGQANGDLFGWPQLEPITNVDAAVNAIESIVEQGEGPRGDWRNAHFGRFLKILDEYLAMRTANPDLEVARPVLPALVRPPETGEEHALITDPTTAEIADLANVAYEVLLQLLYRLLCHVDETDQQIQTLVQVGVGLMFDVIEPLGELLTTLPVGPEHPGRTAGPSFELFYQPDYLLPHRQAAWLLMSEHLAEAADLAQATSATEPGLVTIAEAMRRHSERLRANSS
jgi:CDGSH-type Zn-finger protein/truncated hemoglobin YjbI